VKAEKFVHEQAYDKNI